MIALVVAMLAATAAYPAFWEYVRTETGEDGWTVERSGIDYCRTYTTTLFGVATIAWNNKNGTAMIVTYSAFTNRTQGQDDDLNVAFKSGDAEVVRLPAQRFVSRQPTQGKWELASTFKASTLRSALEKSDQILVLKDNRVVIRATVQNTPLIFKSLDACLAGKSRS